MFKKVKKFELRGRTCAVAATERFEKINKFVSSRKKH